MHTQNSERGKKTMWKRLWLAVVMTLPLVVYAQGENTFVGGSNQFAFDLYAAAQNEADSNLFFSPFSISQAVGMVYAGAAGDTATQMQSVMGFPEPDTLVAQVAAVNESLASRAAAVPEELSADPFALNIANALWGQVGYPFEAAYLNAIEAGYGATLREMDSAQPEAATEEINAWVAEQTEDRIPSIVPEGAITPFTRLVLTNAIYFNASWSKPFFPPQPRPFTLLDGSTVDAPLMTVNNNIRHTVGAGYVAVEVPYIANGLGMIAIAPTDFEAFEDTLDATTFNSVVAGLGMPQPVILTMPPFEISSDFLLNEQLQSLGMTDAFLPDAADFSGITQTVEPFFLSEAIHKAFVKVDENGTEAAAATAMMMETTSAAPSPPIEIRLDRPFIFAIYDRETEAVLFLGRVLDPTA
jgi:serpin B